MACNFAHLVQIKQCKQYYCLQYTYVDYSDDLQSISDILHICMNDAHMWASISLE